MSRKVRSFSPAFKVQVVLELLAREKTASEICREHQIKDSLLYRWKQEFLDRAPAIFEQPTNGEPARIAELERVIGRLTVELEASKKVSSWLNSRSRPDA
jgi:transposase-like protein